MQIDTCENYTKYRSGIKRYIKFINKSQKKCKIHTKKGKCVGCNVLFKTYGWDDKKIFSISNIIEKMFFNISKNKLNSKKWIFRIQKIREYYYDFNKIIDKLK